MTKTISLNVTDEAGNKVFTEQKNGWCAIMLEMKNKPAKQIAKFSDNVLFIKKDRAKHLFRKNNSYGLNRLLITNMPETTSVCVSDQHGIYKLPVKEILQDEETINFDLQGYEPQVLVKISLLEKWKMTT